MIGSAKVVGTFGSAAVGVLGDGAVGGQFSGTDAAISLDPRAMPGPPGGTNFKGDLAVDSDGVMWLCVQNGSPGVWIKVSHGGVRLLNASHRAYDSRLTGGKFADGEQRSVALAGTTPALGIPDNALGHR